MTNLPLPRKLVPNPVTQRQHRRDVFWQILLPILGGTLAVLALAGLTIYLAMDGSRGPITTWANISVIWLILPGFLVGLLVLAALAGLAVLTAWVIKKLPMYTHVLHELFWRMQYRSQWLANAAAEPVVRAHSLAAGLQAVRRKLNILKPSK